MLTLLIMESPDPPLFLALYESFSKPLLNIAYKILHDQRLAEDATQEAFILVFKNLDKINMNDRSKTWHYLVVIVRSVSINMLHREKKHSNLISLNDACERIDGIEPQWSEYQVLELYDELKQAMMLLSDDERRLLLLRSKYDLSYKQISNLMDMNEKNISVRLTRIRRKLRRSLMKEDHCEYK